MFLRQESPDVVFITETKLSHECVVSQYIDCASYRVFRKDRVSGTGGGVMIMVKDCLSVIELDEPSWGLLEAAACRLSYKCRHVNMACIYRPPGSTSDYNALVRKAIQDVSERQGQTLICGDFNFREINWRSNEVVGGENSEQEKFFDTCENCYLYQHP